MEERLQKIISRAGIASRRKAEELIVTGQVEVNGQVVTTLGSKADPERDSIRVSGRRLKMPQRQLTIALNKPDSCVSALVDPAGRPTLRDFLGGVSGRVIPVGGLEYHSTGLVILTSDGALASRVFRALGQGLPQTYWIKVKALLGSEQLRDLGRRFGAIRAARTGPNPWYESQLPGSELPRLRRHLQELGHPVEKLKRVAIGRLELGDIEPGHWRALSDAELHLLDQDLERQSAMPRTKLVTAGPKPATVGSKPGVPVPKPGIGFPRRKRAPAPSGRPVWKHLGRPRRSGKSATGAQPPFPHAEKARHRVKPPSRRKPG